MIAQSEDQLSFLQGAEPATQTRGRKLEEVPLPAQTPPGLPSSLLERRPDIRGAEQNLVAANAQIGAAKALYYPQISLTGLVGGQSRYLLDIATGPARLYTIAPSAIQSIFHAGQIKNQVRLTESQERELLINYQRTIYNALREVSDSLAAFDRLGEQYRQQEQLVRSLDERVKLSELRYRGGLDSYLQVLDAQRNLFTSQLDLARVSLLQRQSVVQVYRALGGGWQ
jgi:multidrug efflux system outer membrane protein